MASGLSLPQVNLGVQDGTQGGSHRSNAMFRKHFNERVVQSQVVKITDLWRRVMRLKRLTIGGVWKLGDEVPVQMSPSSLDHGSKLRGPLSNPHL
ncbi:hypothetical protein TNCV_5037091 [Trichonephila clavipes]|nr:hypothetical protein TNCV_5037091 [Trichonephila clavipes]